MIFLNSASSSAALVFYLPGVCHTLTPRENWERPESRIFSKIGKNTIYNKHPVHPKTCRKNQPSITCLFNVFLNFSHNVKSGLRARLKLFDVLFGQSIKWHWLWQFTDHFFNYLSFLCVFFWHTTEIVDKSIQGCK